MTDYSSQPGIPADDILSRKLAAYRRYTDAEVAMTAAAAEISDLGGYAASPYELRKQNGDCLHRLAEIARCGGEPPEEVLRLCAGAWGCPSSTCPHLIRTPGCDGGMQGNTSSQSGSPAPGSHSPLPRRGDDVECWLKQHRDTWQAGSYLHGALDSLLDDYRLHADTGTPLNDPLGEEADRG